MVSCLKHDQELVCSSCKKSFLFFNAAKFLCKECGLESIFSAKEFRPSAYCEGCRRHFYFEQGKLLDPYVIDNANGVQSCGLDSISGFEEQARNGEQNFRLLDSQDPELRGRRAAYFELVLKRDTGLPVEYVRYIHVYCNFKWYVNQQNTKLLLFAFNPPLALLMEELCIKRGASRLYCASTSIVNVLKDMPAVEAYKSRFY
jgi:predicted RNA-binding Zn-ribbon protein involved in translation (DUF1610 family)